MTTVPDESLSDIIAGFRARLQAELDAQIQALTDNQAQLIDRARHSAETEAEERWTAKLEGLRSEWTGPLEQQVSTAREDASRIQREYQEALAFERRQSAEAIEAERNSAAQALAQFESSIQERQQIAEAREAESARAAQALTDLEAARQDRQRAEQTLETELSKFEQTLSGERAGFQTERERIEAQLAALRAALEADQRAASDAIAEARAAALVEQRRADEVRATIEAERRQSDQQSAEAREAAESRSRELESQLLAARAEAEGARRGAEDAAAVLAEERRRSEAARGAQASARTTVALAPVVDTLRSLDAAASLSEALATVVRGAASVAPRATLFVVSGAQLEEWAVAGVPPLSPGSVSASGHESGLLGDALRSQGPVRSDGNGSAARPPAFAALPSGRAALAVPLVLAGRPVAVLYADEGREGAAPASWHETIEILASHASACLAYLTAARTAQAMQLINAPAAVSAPDTGDDSASRRYARLLISEIKMYHEADVRLGREHRDLVARLGPEIDRARRLYEERLAPSARGRDTYFQQELVQTLAGGDAALLG
jgi:hypothetical protein